MLSHSEYIKQLAHQGSLMSVLGGGIAPSRHSVSTDKERYILRVRIASVSPEELSIEIMDYTLLLCHDVSDILVRGDNLSCRIVQAVRIPSDVNRGSVIAWSEGKEVVIEMPRDNPHPFYRRKLR